MKGSDLIARIVEISGYVAALTAFFTFILKWNEVRNWFKKKAQARYEKEHAIEHKILNKLDGIDDRLKAVEDHLQIVDDNVAVSQLNDLQQLYSSYMEQGYCTVDQRKGFFNLYDRYHGQGHNTLSETFKSDIERLPTCPQR